MIRLENLVKTYRTAAGQVKALEDLDLEIKKGEFIVLRGPSGSGKTTLLMALAGMQRPTSGSVYIDQKNIYQMSIPARAKFRAENIGFVFQMFHLVPYLTVIENVSLAAGAVSSGSDKPRAKQLLKSSGMEQRIFHKPAQLSAGEKQQMKPHFRLDQLSVNVQTGKKPEASVEVYHARVGESSLQTGTGDGPVDAIYRAIDHAVGSSHELSNYSIRSVSEGADAIGEVTVLISHGGAFFKGRAQNTDVLQASADAYIDALNNLEAFRADEENMAFVGSGIIQSFQGGLA